MHTTTTFEQGKRAARELIGRDLEIGRVRDVLDDARSHGGALLLRGGPGAGKSSLIEAATSAASSRRMPILTASGVRLEADLPFAGAHRLAQPFLDRLSQLPAPQRDAVRAAFGMATRSRPEPFLIALAILGLLRQLAGESPLLVVADDVQWLDRSSSEVLAIIARRLEPTRVVLIAAARTGHESPLANGGLPALELGPLGAAAASTLLNESFPLLTDAEREQVLADAAGNPLALHELAGSVRTGPPGYRCALPTLPPLTRNLERAFSVGDLGLPGATRTLLLIAAASDTENLEEVTRAAAVLGVEPTTDWLAPAIRARLVQVRHAVIRFCSPLVRSAVYAEATPSEREAAHASLAGVLQDKPERQAWHSAATISGPDEIMAGELELAAEKALRHGSPAAAISATERAATLTAEPMLRGNRLLHGAEIALELGRTSTVRRLTATARSLPLRDSDQVKAAWLERAADPQLSEDPGSLHMMAELADHASRAGAPDLALSILRGAASSCFWAGHGRQLGLRIVAGVESLAIPADDPRRLAALAFADPIGQGRVVTESVSRLKGRFRTEASTAYESGLAAALVGEVHLGGSLLADAASLLRAEGRLPLLARALTVQAWAAVHRADWAAAIPAAREGIRLAVETGQPQFATVGRGALLLLAAVRGDAGGDEWLALPADQLAPAGPAHYGLAVVQAARGVSAIGAARYSDAYNHLRRILDPGDPAFHHAQQYWCLPDFVEATARDGHHEHARAWLSTLTPDPAGAASPWLRAGLQYATALLAEDDLAEQSFHDAIDAAESLPFIRARAQLAYGSWLRRQRRIAESREPLRAAAVAFDALGCKPWVARTGRELRAAGAATAAAAMPAETVLSPQELEIAQLAASGLTNRQIGRRLYVSDRTVAAHLYRTFPKLGISSRSQISSALRVLDGLCDVAG